MRQLATKNMTRGTLLTLITPTFTPANTTTSAVAPGSLMRGPFAIGAIEVPTTFGVVRIRWIVRGGLCNASACGTAGVSAPREPPRSARAAGHG